jgi:hypothetical protein
MTLSREESWNVPKERTGSQYQKRLAKGLTGT